MGAIAAVLFDLDETLIVEEGAVVEALRATAASVPASRGVAAEVLATTVRATARSLWRAHALWPWFQSVGISSWEGLCGGFEGPGEELARLRAFAPEYRREAWRRSLSEHGVEDAALAADLAERYRSEHAGRRVPYPETFGVLARLKPRFRLGMLTNGATSLQREKARNAGLEPWFDAITVSGEVGVGKPDPRVFRHALERLGAAPETTVMVGDNLERDVGGARALGLRAVWVNRKGAAPPQAPAPDAVLSDLAGLPDLLASWCAAPATARS